MVVPTVSDLIKPFITSETIWNGIINIPAIVGRLSAIQTPALPPLSIVDMTFELRKLYAKIITIKKAIIPNMLR